ncbi:hypothetical protein XENORESO_018671 [Xenotaenia resolanae]|uniref:Uncharacterized protein n=1 Tax=Xenotaenia resolanae TaxID=208358 RepID=A0ABV0WMU8_9TELE
MTVTVVGTGNYQQCVNNVMEIFNFTKCSYSMCSFDGVFQPRVTGSFMVRWCFKYKHFRVHLQIRHLVSDLPSLPLLHLKKDTLTFTQFVDCCFKDLSLV